MGGAGGGEVLGMGGAGGVVLGEFLLEEDGVPRSMSCGALDLVIGP